MKLLLDTLIIFFGTLVAAALVALGEPADPEPVLPLPAHVAVQPDAGR